VVLGPGDDAAVSATLDRLSATLNGYPLDASGELAKVNGALTALDLNVQNASNSIALSGSAGETLDLSWSVRLPEPETLLPALGGAISGQGSFTGTLDSPQIVGSLSADAVTYRLGEGSYEFDAAAAEITTSRE